MILDLASSWAKLKRSRDLITQLDQAAGRARMSGGEAGELQLEALYDPARSVFDLRVAGLPEYPTQTWALLAGDIFHNLRSALDHAAYQLVTTGASPSEDNLRRSQFPICDSESAFVDESRKRLPGVQDAALKQVRESQPFQYHMVELSPIRALRELSNQDKHRLLTSFLLAPDDIGPENFDVVGAKVVSVEAATHIPLEQDALFATIRVGPASDDKTKMTPRIGLVDGIPLYVTFGAPGGPASFWLASIVGAVEHALERLTH